jgi:hypothetical protein
MKRASRLGGGDTGPDPGARKRYPAVPGDYGEIVSLHPDARRLIPANAQRSISLLSDQ